MDNKQAIDGIWQENEDDWFKWYECSECGYILGLVCDYPKYKLPTKCPECNKEIKIDNKEATKNLKHIRNTYRLSANCSKSLDIAIKSLEAWDKILEEIEKNNPENYFSDKPIIITKKTVLETIEKYKKEIEE